MTLALPRPWEPMAPLLTKSLYLLLFPDLLLLAGVRSIKGQEMLEGLTGTEGQRILKGVTGSPNINPR